MRGRVKRYQFVLLGALVFTGAAVAGMHYSANTQITKTNNATQAMIRSADDRIKEIEVSKKAKEQDRQRVASAIAEAAAHGEALTSGLDTSQCVASSAHSNPADIDVIVNKKHCMRPLDYEPSELVEVYGATLSAKAAGAFKALYEAAAAAGQGFSVTSSYRSYQHQIATYRYWMASDGQAGADNYSARPGYSEHQTGLAVDVEAAGCSLSCFGQTSQYAWLKEHASEYGFIQRYTTGSEAITGYRSEEWHFRYVGAQVATDMKKRKISTLEEYWQVPGGSY